MKKFTIAFMCVGLMLCAQNVFSQLYSYTNNVDGYANYVDPNLAADKLRRAKGAHGTGEECPVGFTSKNFTTVEEWNTTLSSVVLRLIPNPGVIMNIEKISSNLRITETGPIYVRYAYSLDSGSTWVDAGFDFTPTIATCIDGSVTYSEWDCPDFSSAGYIYFRFYGYSAVSTTGRMNITDLTIDGTLTMDDMDGDGYGAFIDCNDENADIHPGAEEICNEIDEDCDGISDEVNVTITPTGDIYICGDETVVLSGTPGYASYQWYKNGNPIPVTTSDITVENPGYYQVWASNGDCSAMSEVQAVAVTAMPFANIYTPDGTDFCTDDNDTLKLKASYDELYAWQWYKDGSPVEGEVNYKMPATSAGAYYCEVTTVFGCTRTTETVVLTDDCRMSQATQANTISIYPNPAKDVINMNIYAGDMTGAAVLKINSLNGQEMMSQSVEINNGELNMSIDISEIPAGIYFVRVITENTQINQQFSINR